MLSPDCLLEWCCRCVAGVDARQRAIAGRVYAARRCRRRRGALGDGADHARRASYAASIPVATAGVAALADRAVVAVGEIALC